MFSLETAVALDRSSGPRGASARAESIATIHAELAAFRVRDPVSAPLPQMRRRDPTVREQTMPRGSSSRTADSPTAEHLAHSRWLVQRLRAMSFEEVRVRAVRAVGHRIDDLAWKRSKRVWRHLWMPPVGVAALRSTPFGFLTAERAIDLEDLDPGEARRIVEEADRL